MINKIVLLLLFFVSSTYAVRMYDPKAGRWLNPDPIGVNGGINVYNSVSNNMVNGFAGGESWSGGMNGGVGRFDTSYGVDSWGEDIVSLCSITDQLKKEIPGVKVSRLSFTTSGGGRLKGYRYSHGKFDVNTTKSVREEILRSN